MISLHARDPEPESPVLIYDGGNHALLYRTPGSSVLLDFIHPEVRPYLLKAEQVLIAETQNYQIVREYTVVCRRVKTCRSTMRLSNLCWTSRTPRKLMKETCINETSAIYFGR